MPSKSNKHLDLGDAGDAKLIELAILRVDPDYQRDLRHDLVNKIGLNYDIVKAGPILVSVRDGEYWVVDGQHRVAGALQAGETHIFAHIVEGLDKAGEAELRLARNDRKSDTQQEKWRSRLIMGDEVAHAITEIVQANGTVINLSPLKYSGINSIATLEVLYEIDETGWWLDRTLKLIHEAFGSEKLDPDHLGTSMMKAICWFIGQHIDTKEVSRAEFRDRLATVDIEDVRRKAVSHKAANGGAMWLNYYRALVEVWNFRRTDAKKITWKTIGSIQRLGAQGTRREGWENAGP